MKKSAILFFAALLTITAMAQNVQEGINHLYAERYASAKSTFEKLLAANPNNLEATYWLGQTHLANDNIAAAKALYEKALVSNGNAPLVLVGMGHVELMEGKAGAARQRFDMAIANSRGKKGSDAIVLNAVGRANVMPYSDAKPIGDLDYAIAKLNEAAQIAGTSPDIFLTLGNAYRKKHNGGQAATAYLRAGNFAPAFYRAAMLYKTQTSYKQADSWNVVLENLNNAIKADPRFAPAHEELYYYNLLAKQDFTAAEANANTYISSADPSPENLYFRGQTEFVQKKYPEAITTAKNILSQTNNNPRPRVYRLLAYSYLGAKDTAAACQSTNDYFSKVKEEDMRGEDYLLHAYACGKGNPDMIRNDIFKAVKMDSVLGRQVSLLNEAAKEAKANGQRLLEAELNLMSYNLRGADKSSPSELINIAVSYFFGGAYQKADSSALAYATLAPDSVYGHYWSALARERIDTSMAEGLAMPSYQKTLDVAMTDKVRYKSQGIRAATSLAIYSFNIKNDKAAAIAFADKGLEFDPANSNLLNVKNVASAKPPAPAATPKKTNGSGSSPKPKKPPVKSKTKKG